MGNEEDWIPLGRIYGSPGPFSGYICNSMVCRELNTASGLERQLRV